MPPAPTPLRFKVHPPDPFHSPLALLLAGALTLALSLQAALPLGGKLGWTTIRYGAAYDTANDSLSTLLDTDIVGSAVHGSTYTQFDDNGTPTASDDRLLFRTRLANPTSITKSTRNLGIGIDANGDGRIDVAIAADGRNNRARVTLFDVGSRIATTPKNFATFFLPTGWLPNDGFYPFSSSNYLIEGVSAANDPHWNGDSDLNDDGRQDVFVTFAVPMADITTVCSKPSALDKNGNYGPRGATGIGFDRNTLVRYISFSQTRRGTIDADLNGCGKNYDRNDTFAALGAFTEPMSAAKPVSASDRVIITQPLTASGYINSAQATAFTLAGTATPSRWVRLTISDSAATTADVVLWMRSSGTGAWQSDGLSLGSLDDGVLTFATDLVTAEGGNTLLSGATGDATTAIHDSLPPALSVIPISTAGRPVISGSATDVPLGALVRLTVDPNGDGEMSDELAFDTWTSADGAWSVDTAIQPPTLGTIAPEGLASTARILATTADSAGNTAQALALTLPTVWAQATNSTSPVISGTWGGSNGGTDQLSVTLAGATYYAGPSLTTSLNTWSLTVPASAALSSLNSPYEVTATATRGSLSASDLSSDELRIVIGPVVTITSTPTQANPRPVISGGCTLANSFITLLLDPTPNEDPDDIATYSAATDASGNWTVNTGTTWPILGSFPISGVGGEVALLARVVDANGVQSEANQLLTITARGISISSITSTAVSNTSAVVDNSDFYINRREDDAITVSGLASNAAGLAVTVTVADNDSATANPTAVTTVRGDGSWTVAELDLSALRDGYLNFTAAIAGATASLGTFVHDTSPPLVRFTTPTAIDRAGGTPGAAITGASDLVEGSVIALTLSTGGSGSATVNGAGDWSYIHPNTAGVSINVTATPNTAATDAAGNKPAAAVTTRIATSSSHQHLPNALQISPIAEDNIILDGEAAAVNISGTSVLPAGTAVSVRITKPDGSLVAGPLAATIAGGAWQVAARNLADVKPNSTLVVTATATSTYTYTDVALPVLRLGNASAGVAPRVSITLAGDSNFAAGEDKAVTIAGATLNVPDGGAINLTVADGVPATPDLTRTISVNNGVWNTQPLDLSGLAEGVLTITASVVANGVTATDTGVVNHDRTPPRLAITSGPVNDTSAPVIVGTTDLSPGTAVAVSIDCDDDGTVDAEYQATVQADGAWRLNTTSAIPQRGTLLLGGVTSASRVHASAADPAGNPVGISATTLRQITSDTGVSGQDFVTNDRTLVFSGKAEAAAAITISINGAPAGSTTADAAGAWRFDATSSSLPVGTHTVVALATKSPGVTATATQPVTIDISPPAAAISGITHDSGIAGDFRTSDDRLVFSGSAEAGSLVQASVFDRSGATVANAILPVVGGAWSWDRTGSALPEGAYSLQVVCGDTAGNATTVTRTFEIDQTAGISISNAATTSDPTPEIVGATDIEANRLITLEIDPNNDGNFGDSQVLTASIRAGGLWTVAVSNNLRGTVRLRATGTDENGNSAVAIQQLTIDPYAASVVISEPIGDGELNATEDDAVTIHGTSQFVPDGSNIEIIINDGFSVLEFTAECRNDAWSVGPLNLSALSDGVLTISAEYVDDLDDTFADTATVLHRKNEAASIDSISSDTGTPMDFATSDTTLVFKGSAVPNAVVWLDLTGPAGNLLSTQTRASAAGAWTFDNTPKALAEGNYKLTANTASKTILISTEKPRGPVTVDRLITLSTTPTLTGKAVVRDGETLSVSLNGVSYNVGRDLSLIDGAWTLHLPATNALLPASADSGFDGIYDVDATIVSNTGVALTDESEAELQVGDTVAPVVDFSPSDPATTDWSTVSEEGAITALSAETAPVTLTEASGAIAEIQVTTNGLLDAAAEKWGSDPVWLAADGSEAAPDTVEIAGVALTISFSHGAFTIQKRGAASFSPEEAQTVLRQIRYRNVGAVTTGTREFSFVVADAAGNESAPAIVRVRALATRQAQSIAFFPPNRAPRTGSVTLGATANSGLPVSYEVISGPGLLAGNVLTFSAPGIVKITATQAGDEAYLPATPQSAVIEALDLEIPDGIAEGWTTLYGGDTELVLERDSDARAMAMQTRDGAAITIAVTGSTLNAQGDRDIHTAKLDAVSGEELWHVVRSGAAGCNDEGAAVAIDCEGHVWMAGTLCNNSKNTDFYVAKYAAADGALLWEQTYRGPDGMTDFGHDGPGGSTLASPYQGADFRHNSMALTPDGGVAVTGHITNSAKRLDAITLKFDANGKLLWSAVYDGPAGGADYGQALTVSGEGDIYVAGASANQTLDAILIKFAAASGAQLWARVHDGGKPDAAAAVRLDEQGHPIFCGYSQRATFDMLMAGCDSATGAVTWLEYRDGAGKSSDMAWDLTVVDGGHPVFAGTSYPRNGVSDACVVRMNPMLAAPEQWSRCYDGPAQGLDQFISIGADRFGNSIATGFSQNTDGTMDTQTVKYSAATGAVLWSKRFNGSGGGNDIPRQILVDPVGNVFIAGYSTSASGVKNSWITRYEVTATLDARAQRITFLPPPAQGVADQLHLTASASSGLPVRYEVLNGPAKIDGAIVSFTGMGQVTLRATQSGNADYDAAPSVERTFTVGKSRQSLALVLPKSATTTQAVPLQVKSNSGLPIDYKLVSGPAAIEGGLLRFTGAGTVTVRASQPGDDRFQPAASVEASISVIKADQSITLALPASILASETVPLAPVSTSGLPVSVEVIGGPGGIYQGILHCGGDGVITLRSSQPGNHLFAAAAPVVRAIVVRKAPQTIRFDTPATALVTAAVPLIASSTSGLPVAISVVSGPGVITPDGALAFSAPGSVAVRASQAGNACHLPATSVVKVLNALPVRPAVQPAILAPAYVGQPVDVKINTSLNPTSIKASGLPGGLSLNSVTGRISGSPTAAKLVAGKVVPYRVTFVASNSAGASEAVICDWTILPLPPELIGEFQGLVDPTTDISLANNQLCTGLGGGITLTISAAGSASGKIVLDTISYSFTSRVAVTDDSTAAVNASLARSGGASRLDVKLHISCATGYLTGTVTDAKLAKPVSLSAWRNPWHQTKNPATPYQGAYTAALELAPALAGNPLVPQGNGYATPAISPAGKVNWAGKLSDGVAVTVSASLSRTGALALHLPLYTPSKVATAGALHGWVFIDSANTMEGALTWKKNTQTTTSSTGAYLAGFPAHELHVLGARYSALPTAPSEAGTDAGLLVFSEGGISEASMTAATAGELRQEFRLVSGRTIVMPKGSANPASMSLSINHATGAFTGKFTLRDSAPDNGAAAIVARTVNYSGVLLPRLNFGAGHFLLPQWSPDQGAKLGPSLSGQVLIDLNRF